MAGAGYKLFNTGDVLTAAQVNTYLMEQTVMVFANAAARTTALSGVVSEGMISYLKDTNAVEVYDGSNWVSSDDPNAIQNTIVDAKGDLITATASDVPARLAVGTNDAFLKADSSTSTGLVWDNSGYTTYTPTVTAATGTFTTVSATGRYKRIGKTIILQQVITITTNGTAAGNVQATLPVTAASPEYTGIYREINATGNAGQIQTSTTNAVYRTFTNGYPGNNAYTLSGTIVYEVA